MDVLFMVLDVIVRLVGIFVLLAGGVFLYVLLWDLIMSGE